MTLHEFQTAAEASDAVADLIAARVEAGSAKVLGLSTGKSPVGIYDRLSAKVAAAQLSLADVTSFNLDEYLGIPASHPASFHVFMQRHLFSRVTLAAHHIPDGMADDPAVEGAEYEEKIKAAGGIDLQLLGVGLNGHIGFNEPGSPFSSLTRVVDLDESTRLANAGDFPAGEAVPRQALTMGITTILAAREIALIATGAAKAEVLRAALHGPITTDCPASILQTHPAVHIFADAAAAALLEPGALDPRALDPRSVAP